MANTGTHDCDAQGHLRCSLYTPATDADEFAVSWTDSRKRIEGTLFHAAEQCHELTVTTADQETVVMVPLSATGPTHRYTDEAFAIVLQLIQDGDVEKARQAFTGFASVTIKNTWNADARLIREHVANDDKHRPRVHEGMRNAADLVERQNNQ